MLSFFCKIKSFSICGIILCIFTITVNAQLKNTQHAYDSTLAVNTNSSLHNQVVITCIDSQTIAYNKNFSKISLNIYTSNKNINKIKRDYNSNNFLPVNIAPEKAATVIHAFNNRTESDTFIFVTSKENIIDNNKTMLLTKNEPQLFDRPALKQIKNIITTGVNDVLALAISPLSWDSTSFFIWTPLALGTYIMSIADEPINNWILKDRSYVKNGLMKAGEFYGRPLMSQLSAISFGLYGILRDDNKALQIGLEIYESYLISNSITSLLKRLFGRLRPFEERGAYYFDPFLHKNNPENSFPSGHTTLAFSLSSVLAAHTDNYFYKALLFAPAVLTAFSRIYDNKHWASDVVLGGAVGFFVGNFLVNRHSYKKNDKINFEINDNGSIGFKFNL